MEIDSGGLFELQRRLLRCRTDPARSDSEPELRACFEALRSALLVPGVELTDHEIDGAPALSAVLRGAGGGRSVTLNGHVDVAPGGDGWTRGGPWEPVEQGGRVYGRGATDMKSGVAALAWALRTLAESPAPPGGDVWLHVVSDEERGGPSSRRLAAELPQTDAVIGAEPTGLAVAVTQPGVVHLRVEVEGQAAHAANRYRSLYPGYAARGVSAIDKATVVLRALREIESGWSRKPPHPLLPPGFNTISVGRIEGGAVSAATIPDHCDFECTVWYLPGETLADVRDDVEAGIAGACRSDPWLRAHPPRLTWGAGYAIPPYDTAADDALVAALGHGLERAGRPLQVAAFAAASDLPWYLGTGKALAMFGPGDIAVAHEADEHVSAAEVHDCCAALVTALAAYRAP